MAVPRKRGRAGVVAVVDAEGPLTWVWWVSVGERPGPDMSRLCGAWELDNDDPQWAATLESLTFRRMILPTRDGRAALAAAGVTVERELDVAGTVAAATAARDRAQDAFDTEQARRTGSKLMKVPTWPMFPAALDVEDPPPWDVNDPSMDHLDVCLSIAHWLNGLCARWEDLEEERLGRPLLRKLDGPERDLPLVLVEASA